MTHMYFKMLTIVCNLRGNLRNPYLGDGVPAEEIMIAFLYTGILKDMLITFISINFIKNHGINQDHFKHEALMVGYNMAICFMLEDCIQEKFTRPGWPRLWTSRK